MPIEKSVEGRLARIAINRPEKRNALNIETCQEITAALCEANENASVGAVLLSGNGKAFSAGMDLSEAPGAVGDALAEAHDRLFTFNIWMNKPVVAAVQGAAIAGGTGLAANAHLIVAAEGATFGLTEVRIGLWPVLIYPAMVAAMGGRKTLELALTGRIFDARDAERWGLVSEVVPGERLMERAGEVAMGLANGSSSAMCAGLRYVREIRGKTRDEAAWIGRVVRQEIMRTGDFAEGIRAFQEKRKPEWPSH
jgi:enoyl-CoA hydratase/carnithine racemase